jgi:replication-associated recombination protein RarA
MIGYPSAFLTAEAVEQADAAVGMADAAVGMADAAVGMADAAKMSVALETGEAAAKMDCYSEESVALAAHLEARCAPFAIEQSLF